MQIILLSGGSGSRLWPLSNNARSKQFLRLLPNKSVGKRESMVQRIIRQFRETNFNAPITIATSASQKDFITSQLGQDINIVTEPCRRDTFPAICLACEFLSKSRNCATDEPVVVMPCDAYTDMGYFDIIKEMARAAKEGVADLIVMGISPTYPSTKYGYIIPVGKVTNNIFSVSKFTEKPTESMAARLIQEGALWNGGVFAFRLGYLLELSRKYNDQESFENLRNQYNAYPKISFDYEVAEKATSIAMIQYNGTWKDLGTWDTLTKELKQETYGNVTTDGYCTNTHIFNELNIPLLCMGTNNLVIAASYDGILVTDKRRAENIKEYVQVFDKRPMFEERRWGSYRVIDKEIFRDGFCTLSKHLLIKSGCCISYQRHTYRDEVWTVADGSGELILDGEKRVISRGDTITIAKGQWHGIKALSDLTIIEVQSGTELIEEDIERQYYEW